MTDLLQAHRVRIGNRIRLARVAAGYSHDRLAAKVGTSRQHLIKLEKGQHLPGPTMLAAIADATGKDESYFAADDDGEDRRPMSLDDLLRLRVREIVREESRR